MAKVTIRTMGRSSADYFKAPLGLVIQQVFWIALVFGGVGRHQKTWSFYQEPWVDSSNRRLLSVWQQNLWSTKSHHAKTGIRVTVEMLGNTGTAKDHLQPWCHHPGTESQIAHLHSRIIESWQLLRPSIRIRVDTLSRCSCSLFRFFWSNASSTLLGSSICGGQHLVLSHVHMHFRSRLPCALGEFRYPESKKLNGLEPRIVGFAEHITRCLDCTQRMMWDMIRA